MFKFFVFFWRNFIGKFSLLDLAPYLHLQTQPTSWLKTERSKSILKSCQYSFFYTLIMKTDKLVTYKDALLYLQSWEVYSLCTIGLETITLWDCPYFWMLRSVPICRSTLYSVKLHYLNWAVSGMPTLLQIHMMSIMCNHFPLWKTLISFWMYFLWGCFDIVDMIAIHHYRCWGLLGGRSSYESLCIHCLSHYHVK